MTSETRSPRWPRWRNGLFSRKSAKDRIYAGQSIQGPPVNTHLIVVNIAIRTQSKRFGNSAPRHSIENVRMYVTRVQSSSLWCYVSSLAEARNDFRKRPSTCRFGHGAWAEWAHRIVWLLAWVVFKPYSLSAISLTGPYTDKWISEVCTNNVHLSERKSLSSCRLWIWCLAHQGRCSKCLLWYWVDFEYTTLNVGVNKPNLWMVFLYIYAPEIIIAR